MYNSPVCSPRSSISRNSTNSPNPSVSHFDEGTPDGQAVPQIATGPRTDLLLNIDNILSNRRQREEEEEEEEEDEEDDETRSQDSEQSSIPPIPYARNNNRQDLVNSSSGQSGPPSGEQSGIYPHVPPVSPNKPHAIEKGTYAANQIALSDVDGFYKFTVGDHTLADSSTDEIKCFSNSSKGRVWVVVQNMREKATLTIIDCTPHHEQLYGTFVCLGQDIVDDRTLSRIQGSSTLSSIAPNLLAAGSVAALTVRNGYIKFKNVNGDLLQQYNSVNHAETVDESTLRTKGFTAYL